MQQSVIDLQRINPKCMVLAQVISEACLRLLVPRSKNGLLWLIEVIVISHGISLG